MVVSASVQYQQDLLHGFDGGEDFLQFADDKSPQWLEPLDGLPHKHQHVQCCQLILISQKLDQLQNKHNIIY